MPEILFASTNQGKLKEVRRVLEPLGWTVTSPAEFAAKRGLSMPPEVSETEATYLGNARLKAKALCAWSGVAALGDDTGLEVEALAGRPGVKSARYAGEKASMSENIAKLLKEISGITALAARFVCVLVLESPDGHERVAAGELKGKIARESKGQGGFGYDGHFLVELTGKTLSELKDEALISGAQVDTHRARALRKLFT